MKLWVLLKNEGKTDCVFKSRIAKQWKCFLNNKIDSNYAKYLLSGCHSFDGKFKISFIETELNN